MERHTARYASLASTEDGLRWGQERPQATEPRAGANQQVKGHVRVCAPFRLPKGGSHDMGITDTLIEKCATVVPGVPTVSGCQGRPLDMTLDGTGTSR